MYLFTIPYPLEVSKALKIGIVTHYYNSTNYGACLQAFALCSVLQDMGHEPRQLRIDYSPYCHNLVDPSPLAPVKRLVGRPVTKGVKSLLKLVRPGQRRQAEEKQRCHEALLKTFRHFTEELTPHSEEIYTPRTISRAAGEYDAFITGSDQVFNPLWYFEPFFLTFVPEGKPKLSYAASLAQTVLPKAVQKRYRNHLQSFTALSLREKSTVPMIQELSSVPVHCVLDPTLLPEQKRWAAIAAPRSIREPYAFCYFLGDDPHIRKTAAAYAKEQGWKLVTVPNAAGMLHVHDKDFGDLRLPTPSPEEFLSLIAHSEFVFTDSFHASVFSLIFKRQFVAVPRDGHKAMGTRLADLTALFDASDRFCDTTVTPSQIKALPPVRYDLPQPKFQAAREASLDFLRKSLDH